MSHSPIPTVLITVAGLAAGALLVRPAVFAYTVPEDSRTTCETCGHQLLGGSIAAYADLVLRRRCRSCTSQGHEVRLGPPLLLPELLAALAVGACMMGGARGWILAAQLWIAVIGSALVLIDLSVMRLPDRLTGGAALGVTALLAGDAATSGQWGAFLRAATAAGVTGFAFLTIGLIFSRGIGLGDIKLAPSLAALLGWQSWRDVGLGIAAGCVLVFVQAVALLVRRRTSRKNGVAFGPALLIGALAVSALSS